MNDTKQIISEFAHDVRNPLGGIIGTAELLDLQTNDQPSINKKIKRIISAANAIHELINEFAKNFPSSELDLSTLAEELKKELKEHSEIDASISCQAGSYIVPIDTDQYQDSFLKLALAALESKKGDHKALISLDKEGDCAIFKVTVNESSPSDGSITIKFPSYTKRLSNV